MTLDLICQKPGWYCFQNTTVFLCGFLLWQTEENATVAHFEHPLLKKYFFQQYRSLFLRFILIQKRDIASYLTFWVSKWLITENN